MVEGLVSRLRAGAVKPSLEVGSKNVLQERTAASNVVFANSTNPGVDFLKKVTVKICSVLILDSLARMLVYKRVEFVHGRRSRQ